jgi:hypothetical protein
MRPALKEHVRARPTTAKSKPPVFKTAATNSATIGIIIPGASTLRCVRQGWPKTSHPRVLQQKLKAFKSAPGCKRLAFLPCAKRPARVSQQYNFDCADILHSSMVNIGLKITVLTTYPASDWTSRHKAVAADAHAVLMRLAFAAAAQPRYAGAIGLDGRFGHYPDTRLALPDSACRPN